MIRCYDMSQRSKQEKTPVHFFFAYLGHSYSLYCGGFSWIILGMEDKILLGDHFVL